MNTFADQQTLDDLNIPGRHKFNSIMRLFDKVITNGGRKLLEDMFRQPLTDAEAINKRSGIFNYFTASPVSFPFSEKEFAVMENYLSGGSKKGLLKIAANVTAMKFLQVSTQDKDLERLHEEINKTIELLTRFKDFITNLDAGPGPFSENLVAIKNIFNNPKLQWLITQSNNSELSLSKLIRYDHLLRTTLQEDMQLIKQQIFQLDVYIAVANVAAQHNFCYARALTRGGNVLNFTGLFHPVITNAVGNSFSLQQKCNVMFLTGANMAGKSTLMKSIGIAVYLAHMGFPVAAAGMEFSVKDGLYTSINVSDNLDMGYSHFYAEVLRVKTVAQEVAADKDLVVIFDELFKGTNVKDAYDGTLSITKAFAENRNCFFVISTHITEVGEQLLKDCDNFRFEYLPTIMNGSVPKYTYTLSEGITKDRHGMTIIENEDILDIIRFGAKR